MKDLATTQKEFEEQLIALVEENIALRAAIDRQNARNREQAELIQKLGDRCKRQAELLAKQAEGVAGLRRLVALEEADE